MTERLPLLLTQGDPAGIGPEITIKAWRARRELDLPPFGILADPEHLRRTGESLSLGPIPVARCEPEEIAREFDTALPVVPLSHAVAAEPGRPDASTAAATLESIERAVALTRAGRARALVTNPIAKHVLYRAGFSHPGHTEYLAELAREHEGAAPPRPVMMLWSEALAVVPVTIHVPLAQVPSLLTEELIVDTARIVTRDLRRRFGIRRPRIALTGLNPHAGEAASMGTEERDIIEPAVAVLRNEGIDASGPWPADTMFHARAREGYDAALAMYHDQGLVPIKTIAFDEAVNVTLGLPFVRTSPDHGTAFDIAGRGVANPASLIAAIRLAGRLGSRSGVSPEA